MERPRILVIFEQLPVAEKTLRKHIQSTSSARRYQFELKNDLGHPGEYRVSENGG
jgi:hypothetical protein